jgi:hypothetical protein
VAGFTTSLSQPENASDLLWFLAFGLFFSLRLLLLLGLRLFGRSRRRLVNDVGFAVTLGLFRQPQIGLGKPPILGLPKWIGFRPCECGQIASLDAILLSRGHWPPLDYVIF